MYSVCNILIVCVIVPVGQNATEDSSNKSQTDADQDRDETTATTTRVTLASTRAGHLDVAAAVGHHHVLLLAPHGCGHHVAVAAGGQELSAGADLNISISQ